jgi:hypothetical protein
LLRFLVHVSRNVVTVCKPSCISSIFMFSSYVGQQTPGRLPPDFLRPLPVQTEQSFCRLHLLWLALILALISSWLVFIVASITSCLSSIFSWMDFIFSWLAYTNSSISLISTSRRSIICSIFVAWRYNNPM